MPPGKQNNVAVFGTFQDFDFMTQRQGPGRFVFWGDHISGINERENVPIS